MVTKPGMLDHCVLGDSIYPTLPWQCLSEETLKAVGPFYLLSTPGKVKYPTQMGRPNLSSTPQLWNIPVSALEWVVWSIPITCILVWPTSWIPAVGGLIVCVCVCVWVCVSEDMSPYCSAHDEWLIMILACMSGTMMPTLCQILVVTQWPN